MRDTPPEEPGSGNGLPPEPRAAPALRRALALSVVVAGAAGVVLLVDLLGGPRLPVGLRPLLPFVLAAALCAALVLGVGAYGSPRRPGDR